MLLRQKMMLRAHKSPIVNDCPVPKKKKERVNDPEEHWTLITLTIAASCYRRDSLACVHCPHLLENPSAFNL